VNDQTGVLFALALFLDFCLLFLHEHAKARRNARGLPRLAKLCNECLTKSTATS